MKQPFDYWFVVPARAGSRGVVRKNMRLLGNKPLIAHVLCTLKAAAKPDHAFVITDCEEIAGTAKTYSAKVIMEPRTTGKATLDEVICNALPELSALGAMPEDVLLTIQPTSPFITTDTIAKACAAFDSPATGCVLTAKDARHLAWTTDKIGAYIPAYAERVNRQELPPYFTETGGIIAARIRDIQAQQTRIIPPIHLIPLGEKEGLDIDTPADFKVAQYYLTRKRILIRADAGAALGMGHVHRALAIAQELAFHKPTVVTREDDGYQLGAAFLGNHPLDLVTVQSDDDFIAYAKKTQPDCIMVDQLDTAPDYMRALKETGAYLVSFEDGGEGASVADIVVNDLYAASLPNATQWTGIEHAILQPSFENAAPQNFSETVETLLVLFGGTDPNNLTQKTLEALSKSAYAGRVIVVQGMGKQNRISSLESYGLKGELLEHVEYMPGVMQQANMAISSAGRTVTELLSLGIPTLVLCQNDKELQHSHACEANGALNLGLGTAIDAVTLGQKIETLLADKTTREQMHICALTATKGRSNAHILDKILALMEQNHADR